MTEYRLKQQRSRKTARHHRLPTEVEWEPAARAGGYTVTNSNTIRIAVFGFLLACTVGAQADEGAVLYEAKLCNTCHGEDGTHPATADYPVMAGQPGKYLVRQMRDIRDGRRTNGLSEGMQAAVESVTDNKLKKIAEWLASRW